MRSVWRRRLPLVDAPECRPDPEMLRPRESHIETARRSKEEPFDVVIVGGGCSGASLALDCASRGLSACLLEANDFGGASSIVTDKLFAGNLRQLEAALRYPSLQAFRAVYTNVQERRQMRLLGGNLLTQTVGFLIPTSHFRPLGTTAIELYKMLGKCVGRGKPSVLPSVSDAIPSDLAQFHVPALKASAMRMPFKQKFRMIFEGVHFDHRSSLHIIQTASQLDFADGFCPSTIINHAPVVRAKKVANSIESVTVVDKINNEEMEIFGKYFVNACGPFSDHIINALKTRNSSALIPPRLLISSAIHFSLPKRILGNDNHSTGIMSTKLGSGGGCVYLLPYRGIVVAGTTETLSEPHSKPCVTDGEVLALSQDLAKLLGIPFHEISDSILAVWKGYRPILQPVRSFSRGWLPTRRRQADRDIVRENENLFSALGGNWTIARRAAKDTMDTLMKADAQGPRLLTDKASRSRTYQLAWSASIPPDGFTRGTANEACTYASSLRDRYPELDSDQVIMRLVRTYGYFTESLLRRGAAAGRNEYLDSSGYLKSEVDWIVDKEYVGSVDDVVVRRMALPFIGVDHAVSLLPSITHELAIKKRWRRARIREEVQTCALSLSRMIGKPSAALQDMASSGTVPPTLNETWLWN